METKEKKRRSGYGASSHRTAAFWEASLNPWVLTPRLETNASVKSVKSLFSVSNPEETSLQSIDHMVEQHERLIRTAFEEGRLGVKTAPGSSM